MEVLGAQVSLQSLTLVVAVKTNHPPKDLEGAPTRGAGVTTLTRTTGREIDLLLGTSAAETVTSRAIGMTVTVEVVVVNRSKYSLMIWVLTPPPCNSQVKVRKILLVFWAICHK